MNGQKQKFSELKKQAREAMAGRCGTLVGATAINLFLTFSCSPVSYTHLTLPTTPYV